MLDLVHPPSLLGECMSYYSGTQSWLSVLLLCGYKSKCSHLWEEKEGHSWKCLETVQKLCSTRCLSGISNLNNYYTLCILSLEEVGTCTVTGHERHTYTLNILWVWLPFSISSTCCCIGPIWWHSRGTRKVCYCTYYWESTVRHIWVVIMSSWQ